MSGNNSNAGRLFACIFEVLVGILLLIDPVGFTSGIIIVFGIVLTLIGAVSLFKYFRADAETAAKERSLTKGLIFVIFGLFCAFKSEWFVITFPLLSVLYGILCLLIGVSKLQWTVDMLRAKRKYWFVEAIASVLTIVCAVLILGNPFSSAFFLWTFIGVTMIIEALVDISAFVLDKRHNG